MVIRFQATDKISLVTEQSALRLRDAMAWRLAATSRSRKLRRVNPRKDPKSSFPRVVRRALFSALKSVRPSAFHIPRVSYPHSPSHSHILRPHVRLTTATSLSIPFIVPFLYFKMRSSSRPAHRHPSHSHRTPSRPHRRFAFLRAPSAMFSTFNIIRASVYCMFLSSTSRHRLIKFLL